ncbi:MAG: double zinc ribbon domain-containing protein [Anaerolineae bacterium]
MYRQVLDLFVPPRCVVCKQVGTWLCDRCVQQIPLFDAPLCPRCGRPEKVAESGVAEDGEPEGGAGHLCAVCRVAPLRVAPICSAFLFKDEIRDVIHALKYRGASDILKPLAGRLAESWHYHNIQSDVLVPVPLHANREAKRGYNQAALIAKAIGRQVGVPVANKALLRVRETASQTHLNRNERKRNVEAAFTCVTCAPFTGRRVTLVDDVATTGATLDACAAALLTCDAQSVNAFTLARAP